MKRIFLLCFLLKYLQTHTFVFRIELLIITNNILWLILRIRFIFSVFNMFRIIKPLIFFIYQMSHCYFHTRILSNVLPEKIFIDPLQYQSKIQHSFLISVNCHCVINELMQNNPHNIKFGSYELSCSLNICLILLVRILNLSSSKNG